MYQGNSVTVSDEPGGDESTQLIYFLRGILSAPYQEFRGAMEKIKDNPHPNILSVIEFSDTLSPLCIMSPWMPDGNIIQYTKANPGANRLMLVRARQLEYRSGRPTTYVHNSLPKRAGA